MSTPLLDKLPSALPKRGPAPNSELGKVGDTKLDALFGSVTLSRGCVFFLYGLRGAHGSQSPVLRASGYKFSNIKLFFMRRQQFLADHNSASLSARFPTFPAKPSVRRKSKFELWQSLKDVGKLEWERSPFSLKAVNASEERLEAMTQKGTKEEWEMISRPPSPQGRTGGRPAKYVLTMS